MGSILALIFPVLPYRDILSFTCPANTTSELNEQTFSAGRCPAITGQVAVLILVLLRCDQLEGRGWGGMGEFTNSRKAGQ